MLVLTAFLIDLLIGDPRWLIHPAVLIGRCISALEQILRRFPGRITGLRPAGVLLTVLIVGGTYAATWLLIRIAAAIHPLAGLLLTTWLISTTLAAKGLYLAGREIFELLKQGNLDQARHKLSWIVGRDTETLEEPEIVRATVETVAENIVDGIGSPLFYALIGGAPLAMAYRAVNTLDSMVGYKNEKYLDFGWASARFDDLANFVPARLIGLLLPIAAALCGLSGSKAWQIMFRDAAKHPSPNSGFPEAAVAGALGIRLGGLNYYGGQASQRAYMGDAARPLEQEDIRKTWRIMFTTAGLALALGLAVLSLIQAVL